MSTNNKQISALNKLITALYDGEKGYKEAAEEVDIPLLATRFRTFAQQRYDFGHELKPFITQMGGEVDKGSSTTAAIHRVWMDLKSALSTNDEEAILRECVRGEESAVETYQEVLLEESLPVSVRAVITNQLNQITSSLAEVRKRANAFADA